MLSILFTIHQLEKHFDSRAERFVFQHPSLGLLIMYICVPVFLLLAVGLCTTAIILPISWLCGWI